MTSLIRNCYLLKMHPQRGEDLLRDQQLNRQRVSDPWIRWTYLTVHRMQLQMEENFLNLHSHQHSLMTPKRMNSSLVMICYPRVPALNRMSVRPSLIRPDPSMTSSRLVHWPYHHLHLTATNLATADSLEMRNSHLQKMD